MTDDLCRFFIEPGTVGLRPGLQPKLQFLMLLCRSGLHPSGSSQSKAASQTGKWKCSFRTCLKDCYCHTMAWMTMVLDDHIQHLRSLVSLTSSTDNIMVNIQMPILSVFLWFQRRQHVGFFCFLNVYFFILFPDYCENTVNSYLCLLVLASHSPECPSLTFVPAFQQKAGQSAEQPMFCVYLLPECSRQGHHSGWGERCSPWNFWQMTLWVI